MTRTVLVILAFGLLAASAQAIDLGDLLRLPPPTGPTPVPYPNTGTGGGDTPTINLAPGTNGIFLYVEGIAGASTSESFTNWIEASDWEYSAQLAVARPVAGGGGAGRPDAGPLVVVKPVDVATPNLLLACVSGRQIPRADLVVASNGQMRLHIAMEDVLVVRVGRQLADGDGENTERVHLSAARVRWEVPQYAPTGALGGTVSAGWDFGANRAW